MTGQPSRSAPSFSRGHGGSEELFAGRYRIDSVLGTGGMGIVYAATHVELGLPVALKLMHPALAGSSEARARFSVEARAVAALKSPHVVRVYDAGELGTEQCFVVMERLEGCNLDQLLQAQGRLPVETAVGYVLEACAALREAHGIGLVHRDLKPENLFLAHYRCSGPVLKVMDFGIARWHEGAIQRGRLTQPGSNLGSPCYQSPEQVEKPKDVDERSDIWSLGLVLFELLTGDCPFDADTLEATRWKTLHGPRPSLVNVLPDVPAELDRVVSRCLALDPSQRFSSVTQLAAALRPFAARRAPGGAGDITSALRNSARAGRAAAERRAPGPRNRWTHSAFLAGLAFALGAGCATAAPNVRWSGIEQGVRSASTALFRHAHEAVTQAGGLLDDLLP